jgi:hypothetical protein
MLLSAKLSSFYNLLIVATAALSRLLLIPSILSITPILLQSPICSKMQSTYFSVVSLAAKSHALCQAPDLLSNLHSSPPASRSISTTPQSKFANPKHANNIQSISSFSLLKEVRASRPAVRYTVYAGLGLMATVESAIWINVFRAKFFPSRSQEEKRNAEVLLERVRGAVAGFKAAWMGNYGRYYAGYVWGVGER